MAATIRLYEPQDAAQIARLYYDSVRGLGPRRYTHEQVVAWAPTIPDIAAVQSRCSDGRTVLVSLDPLGALLAYADLEPNGHVDHLYVRPEAAGAGIAGALLDRVIVLADQQGLNRLYTEASELARSVFASRGFTVVERRDFERRGVLIWNWSMERRGATSGG